MYKENMKLLAAVISASMIACSTYVPAMAEEAGESETVETVLTTATSTGSPEILAGSEDNTITVTESGIVSSGSGTSVTESDGVHTVKISENGIYSLSGEGANVVISIGKNLDVTLEVEDLSVDNTGVPIDEDGVPVNSLIETGAGTVLDIVLNGDLTVNGGESAVNSGKGSVTNISGEGTLTSKEAANGALSAKNGEINISSGTVNLINSKDDGIKAKGGMVKISGGTVTITECSGDGIQAENVDISGGSLSIDTWYEGAATDYYSSGSYSNGSSKALNYLWESGDSLKYERINVDTGSHKGIKAGTKAKTISFSDGSDDIVQEASGSLKISGGNISIDTTKSGLKANSVSTSGYSATKSGKYIIGAPDDAISCNTDIEISGGNIGIASSDDGISSMETLTVTGDSVIAVNASYEGIEAREVVIGTENGSDAPEITINSADDGINTSGKTLYYTYDSASGYEDNDDINYTKRTESSSSGNNMTVYGGCVTVNIDSEGTKTASLPDGTLNDLRSVSFRCSGDGIDCNGSLTQNGGEIYVYGQSFGDNSPIDTNSGYTFNSGSRVLGTGVDGMNESKPGSGTGSFITYGSGSSFGMPGNNGSGTTPPEMPGNNGSGTTPPEMPGNNGSGTTPPEMGSGMGNGSSSFSAGQYWAVLDSGSRVVDFGELKYSGSFIVYGSDLISGGGYTLTVTDLKPSYGDVIEENDDSNAPDPAAIPEDTGSSGGSNASSGNSDTISGNTVKGSFKIGDDTYEYQYTGILYYNGKKQKLSDLTINGVQAGNTLSGNIVFKSVRYKRNRKVGEATAIPVLKAKKGADSATKKAVRALNKKFKSEGLSFNIVQGNLDEGTISGKAVYNSKKGTWKFSLKRMDQNGIISKIRYSSKGKKDFTVDPASLDETAGTVMIRGTNYYKGTAVIPVTVK